VQEQWKSILHNYSINQENQVEHLEGYFHKVDNFIDVSSPLLHCLELGTVIDRYVSDQTILEYYLFQDVNTVKTLFTKNYCKIPPTAILYAHIIGEGLLAPHIDHGTFTCLNFYITANEDRTIFFEKKNPNGLGESYPGKAEANIFQLEDVKKVGQFIACDNESYLLNVSKIHCVHKINNTKRSFINFAWNNHTYEEVLEALI
jgi:hypothetical protein